MLQLLAQSSSDYLYETSTTSSVEAEVAFAMLGALMIPLLVIAVLSIIAMWKIFTKAGKPGWAAIIPIYNLVVMLQIATMPLWWLAVLLLSFIPFVGTLVSISFSIILGINIGRKFGKSDVWGAVLNGILSIGYLIIGFGSATYNASAPVIVGNSGGSTTSGASPTSGSPTPPPTTPVV